MKNRLSYLIAVVLFLGLGTSDASVQIATAHQRSEPPKETFIGEVTRNPEIDYDSMDQLYRHIIYDETRTMNYFLDDDGKAEKFDESGRSRSKERPWSGKRRRFALIPSKHWTELLR